MAILDLTMQEMEFVLKFYLGRTDTKLLHWNYYDDGNGLIIKVIHEKQIRRITLADLVNFFRIEQLSYKEIIMIKGLTRMHIHWMLEDMKRRERRKANGEKNFMDYRYKDIAAALKDYLGRNDDYCVIYRFVDNENLMVLHQKQWIKISYEQLKIFL